MKDVVLYVESFTSLVKDLMISNPELLDQKENGDFVSPPVINAFARTPAKMKGDGLMVYARLTDAQYAQWNGMKGIEILGEADFVGTGTADTVYQQIFDDTEKLRKYKSVYDFTPYEVTVEPPEGEEGEAEVITVTPPEKFGILMGA
ncbi:MAG: hypothetical protein CMF22_11455 [Idiomarinaceae bacterium]|nr:hypothetical protein [Idiomarinaceae bacterium]